MKILNQGATFEKQFCSLIGCRCYVFGLCYCNSFSGLTFFKFRFICQCELMLLPNSTEIINNNLLTIEVVYRAQMPNILCFQLLFSVSYCCKLNIIFLVVSCWLDKTSYLKPFSILWHFRLTSNGRNN